MCFDVMSFRKLEVGRYVCNYERRLGRIISYQSTSVKLIYVCFGGR